MRARPSSPKRDCVRRATSTGGKVSAGVHAKSRLTLEPLRTLRSEDRGQAGACPERTRAIPCKVRVVTTEVSMIRNMRGMVLAAVEMSDRVRAGRVHKFARPERPLRSRERAFPGATLGATRTNDLAILRTSLNNRQGVARGDGRI